MRNVILQGNVLDKLKEIPDNHVDCIFCSPPYFNLRDYGNSTYSIWGGNKNCEHEFDFDIKKLHSGRGDCGKYSEQETINDLNIQSGFCKKCNAWHGQLGLEPTIALFIEHLTEIFGECKRVLKDEGSLFINIKDSYWGGGHGGKDYTMKNGTIVSSIKQGCSSSSIPKIKWSKDYTKKCLCLVPERLSISLVDNLNYILRNVIIWQKPNQLPESVTDRFTRDYEYIYFFTKQEEYFFQTQFEPYDKPLNRWGGDFLKKSENSLWDKGTFQNTNRERKIRPNENGRINRSVWSINTIPTRAENWGSR